ncbi:oligosaccharide flippase family protein [Halobacteriaceae archaeon GCM10025711]
MGTVAGFLATLTFARLLGASGLGIYAIFVSVEMLAATAISFGVYETVTQGVSAGDREAEYYTSGLLVILVGTGVATAVVVALQAPINDLFTVDAALAVPFGVLSWGLFRVTAAFLEGTGRVALAGAVENTRFVIALPIQVGLYLAGYGVFALIWGIVAAQFLTFGVLYGYARVVPSIPTWASLRTFLGFSTYTYIKGLSSQLFKHADYVLLGAFLGTSVTGVYKVSFTLAESSMLFSSALRQVTFPEFARLDAADAADRIRDLLGTLVTYAGLLSLPIAGGGALVGNLLVLTVYSIDAGVVDLPVLGTVGLANVLVPVLAVAALLNSYRTGLEGFFIGTNRPRIAATSGVVLAGVYAVLVVPAMRWFGSTGLAAVTTVSFAVSVAVLFRALDYPVPRQARVDVARQAGAVAVMVVVVYGAQTVLPVGGTLALAVYLTVGAVTYFAVLLAASERIRADTRGLARQFAGRA